MGFRAARGELEVELSWRGDPADRRGTRIAIFGLLGEVAESATYARELVPDRVFEVATGMLGGDTEFASHGHVLTLRVVEAVPGKS